MGARPVTRLRPPAGSAEPAAHPTMLLKGRRTAASWYGRRVVRPRRHRFSTDFRSSGDHNSVENAIPAFWSGKSSPRTISPTRTATPPEHGRPLPLPEHPSSRTTPGRTCRATNDALEDDRTRPSRRARHSDPHPRSTGDHSHFQSIHPAATRPAEPAARPTMPSKMTGHGRADGPGAAIRTSRPGCGRLTTETRSRTQPDANWSGHRPHERLARPDRALRLSGRGSPRHCPRSR